MAGDPPGSEEIKQLTSTVRDLTRKVSDLADAVRQAAELQRSTQSELRDLQDRFRGYVKEDRLARARQYALTALGQARAEHDRVFGRHEAVRRGALAIVQAIETGTVGSDGLVHAANEMLLDLPDYWLAAAAAALGAWAARKPSTAQRATAQAMDRDPGKSALFFCLTLARFGRQDDAARWIDRYLSEQNCKSLTGEFAAVLDLTAQGALGEPAREALGTVCQRWRDQLWQRDELASPQVQAWRTFISGRHEQLAGSFDVLAELSQGWAVQLRWIEEATAFGETERWVSGLLAAASPHADGLSAAADRLLRDMITEPGGEERALIAEVARWQAEVGRDGSRHDEPPDRVPKSRSQELAEAGTADLLTLATALATGQRPGLSAQAARFALLLCGDLIKRALDDLALSAEGRCPPSISIAVNGWAHVIRPGDDPAAARQAFATFANEQLASASAEHRRWRMTRAADIHAEREASVQRGQDAVFRGVAQANTLYQRWRHERAAAARCPELLAAAPPWPSAREQASMPGHGARRERLAVELPRWDLRPPGRPD